MLVQAHLTFIGICKKYFVRARPSGSAYVTRGDTPYKSSKPNFTQRRQWACPGALILNIEGATVHSCLINWSGTKYKAVLLYIILTTITFLIFNRIIFRFDGFQPHLPAVISTTRMLVLMNKSLRTLLLKFTIFVVTLFFDCFFFKFLFYRSYILYTRYISFLNWTWIFLLWSILSNVSGGIDEKIYLCKNLKCL